MIGRTGLQRIETVRVAPPYGLHGFFRRQSDSRWRNKGVPALSGPTFDLPDLRKSLTESAKSAVERCAKAKIEGALRDQLSEVSRTLTSELLSGFLGSITKAWLGVLLGGHDKVVRKLDVLIGTPLAAGSRAAQEALALEPLNEDEQLFRETRLEFAFNQLETAYTYATAQRQPDWELYYILFLQGLCARE